MNNLLLFTVYYPGADKFSKDFFISLLNQTNKQFDLLILNDTSENVDIASYLVYFNIIVVKGVNNIAQNRSIGINYAIQQNYNYLMLCDIDDYFSSYRVENSLEKIKDFDIVVNDLNIVTSNNKIIEKSYFSHRINQNTILDKSFILDKNIFGFSNTTLRIDKISPIEFPKDLRIVDWYFFTLLLRKGLRAVFLPKALTNYRQHSDNMIGLSNYTVEVFRNQVKLKKKHYNYFKDSIEVYAKLYEQTALLENLSDEDIQAHIKFNQSINSFPLWWENIK